VHYQQTMRSSGQAMARAMNRFGDNPR